MIKNILLFIPSFESGGVERNAVFFANSMVDRGYKVYVLYVRKSEKWFSILDRRVVGLKVINLFSLKIFHERFNDALNMIFLSHKILKKIKKSGDTVMVSFQSNAVSILLAKIHGIPISVRISNHYLSAKREDSYIRKISEFAKILTYRFSNKVIANSEELAADYSRILKRKVEIIQNPVDFDMVNRKKTEDIDDDVFLNAKRPILITAGRLTKQKNHALLIKSISYVVKEHEVSLFILGKGEERINLERLIKNLRLENHVFLIGEKNNIYKYFSRSDIFILSSDYEGMPNVVLEAISCGLPVISTRCKTGPSEILALGKGGFLVPVGDARALADQILQCLRDSSSLIEKKNFSEKHIRYKYSSHRISDLYDSMVNSLFGLE